MAVRLSSLLLTSHAETDLIISNLESFNKEATAYVETEVEAIMAQHRDEVRVLQEEIATLSKEKAQLFKQLDQEPKSKWGKSNLIYHTFLYTSMF